MRLLRDAFEYNGWATRQLGGVCLAIPAQQLTRKEDWQYQPILDLWGHMNEVERGYLKLMGATSPPEPAHEMEAYLQSADACREAFIAFAGSLDDAGMEWMFNIPWFERDFTIADGLFQVITHSIEHRADIAHFLGRLGHETPPIDYIVWIYIRDGGVRPG